MRESAYPLLGLPRQGEVQRLVPVEPAFTWFTVHRQADWSGLQSPCIGPDCPWCLQGCRKGSVGYMPSLPVWRPSQLVLAQVLPGVWERCSELHAPGFDLRQHLLLIGRRPGRGAPVLTLEVAREGDMPRGPFKTFPTCTECLLHAWHLPEDLPDYRAAVYFHLVGRVAPEASAAPANGLGVS
jgi:hypothetical protein